MVGHSMGGLLTARFVQRSPDRLAGAAFLGAVLGDWPWARAVLAEPSLPEEPSDPDGMSRTRRPTAATPRTRSCTTAATSVLCSCRRSPRSMPSEPRSTASASPWRASTGSADPFVPPGPTVQAVLDMPSPDKLIRVYPGAKHELVNETNRDEVLADLVAAVGRWVA